MILCKPPYERDFYPDIEPYGKPVVFLHGGPGAACNPEMRRFFDPDAYRIILFDQRGCGKSTPSGSLLDNTTWHLVSDIEALREHLGIDKWQVFGGSWGSTLALAYAQTHPERVTELVLRGLFTLRRSELLWFYQDGASHVYPDFFEGYVAPIPPEAQVECARAWARWEFSAIALWPDPEKHIDLESDQYAIAFARIESHFFVNGGFFDSDDQIIRNLDKIRHIPCVMVQGRYDICTPMQTAWDIHKAWPEADFRLVGDAGHTSLEPGIVHELILATDRFAGRG